MRLGCRVIIIDAGVRRSGDGFQLACKGAQKPQESDDEVQRQLQMSSLRCGRR